MIIRRGAEVREIYRQGQAVIEVYRGQYKVFPSIEAYLRANKDTIWLQPWEIEELLIESNVDWTIE